MRKIAAMTVGLALILAGCGGSDDNNGTGASGNGNDSESEFNKLYEKRKDAKIRVTYTTLDNDGSVSDTFTVSQDGPDRSAYIDVDDNTRRSWPATP